MVDANILLDSLVLESDGSPRSGKQASDVLLDLCDQGVQHGLVAWHTLPIVAYYYGRQHSTIETGAMMNSLLAFLEVPTVGHQEAARWRTHGISDFEDALQMAAAIAGRAEVFVTRNKADFQLSPLPVMTPEAFLTAYH
ncbi:MAG: PIN domain-containing protein [Verrucomicrobiaceae bacterium]|nr:PIN domain-containing protein [Verrucomicrobiaceae bacterium]